MSSLLSVSLYQYFELKGEKHVKVNAVSPFSLRQPVKNRKEFRLDNDIVGMTYDLKLETVFDKALEN